MRKTILPKKIIEFNNINQPNNLINNQIKQVVLRFDNEWKNSITRVIGKGYIIIDFGMEMNGGISIITGSIENNFANIRIRFGESLSEVNSNIGDKNSTNHHSVRDMSVGITMFSKAVFGDTGFRFVRIDFLDENKIDLQNITCINNILVKKSLYKYKGNDKEVLRIFNVAKRTIDLCTTDDYVWDGVKRDRLVWVGDIHPMMLALTTLYGRVKQIENSLDFIKQTTQKGTWMNGIPTYSMWWIIILVDYYELIGAKDYAEEKLEYINEILKLIENHVDEQGNLTLPMYFLDWQTNETVDAVLGVQAVCLIAVKKALNLFKDFGFDVSTAEKLLIKLNKYTFNSSDKKQVIALKYFLNNKLTDEDYSRLIKDGARGISTFMSYYILKAIASRDSEKAIEIMKEYYGAMIVKGATTFWEDFDVGWIKNSCNIDEFPPAGQKDIHGDYGAYCYKGFRHSLCHGWASGVIKFIKEYC